MNKGKFGDSYYQFPGENFPLQNSFPGKQGLPDVRPSSGIYEIASRTQEILNTMIKKNALLEAKVQLLNVLKNIYSHGGSQVVSEKGEDGKREISIILSGETLAQFESLEATIGISILDVLRDGLFIGIFAQARYVYGDSPKKLKLLLLRPDIKGYNDILNRGILNVVERYFSNKQAD